MSADFPDPPAFNTGDTANPGQLVSKLQQMRELLLRITGSTGPNKGMTAWEAFGAGGGGSNTTTIIGGGGGTGGTPDLTPPPTPTLFSASAAISNIIVTCANQTYTAGGGHLFSRLYGATYSGSGPLPTFSDAVLIDTFAGTVEAVPENPATEWHLWLTWVTKANVESTSPAGGTNGVTATTGQDVTLLLNALNGQITQSQLFSSLSTRIDLIDAASSTPGSVNARVAAEAITRSTDDGKLFAQYTVKIDVNGYVSGFGLASTLINAAPTSAFIVRADSFSIASPSGPGISPVTPFVVRTTSATVNGVVVPVGVYMDAAFIENGTITSAKIGNLQVDDAKIASASVAKLTAGSLQVGAYIRSTSFVAGSAGWTINADGTAEFGATAIRGQLVASQIDTRNLTIKDSGGNVLFGAGVTVSVSLLPQNVQNNLLDCSWWQLGTAVTAKGWTINGNTGSGGSDSFFVGTNAQDASEVLWRSIADNSGGSSGSGGWNPGGTSFFNFDGTKTYRFVIPIYRSGGASGSVYWGIVPNSVCSLNTTTAHSNPYFVGGVSPTTSKWFLYVGYVFPYGSTGNSHTGAGYYDMTTGELVAGGSNWNWASAGTVGSGPRAYQFYASAGSTQYFGKPRIELVDGGEESLAGILATGSVSARNQVTSGNASTYIANAAIDSAQINNLRTSNYVEDGSGNATAGAKLASAGTALKVANAGLQVGSVIFTDYWVRLVQGIDGANGTALIWRGNNDSSTRGGAPNINCLSIVTRADQTITGNFEQTYLSYTLTPTTYTSYSDNLDAMTQIHMQFFASTSSSFPFTETYQPMASRTYDGASGIVQGSLAWGWRYGGVGAETTASLEVNNTYSACIRVRIANTYGFSATKDLYGGGSGASVGRTMTATTITGASGSSGGGGGSTGGACPAPWVKIALLGGRKVDASDLFDGSVIEAVNDNNLAHLPKGGIVRHPQIIWRQRIRVTTTDGRFSEYSIGHRLCLTSLEWVCVQDIRPGDHIMGPVENIVASIESTGEGPVVSFQVEGAGTYFSGDMLSHNSKAIP